MKTPEEPAAAEAVTPNAVRPAPRDPAEIVNAWWAEFFPENGGPVPYLSGLWHYCHDAKDDLIRRLTAPDA